MNRMLMPRMQNVGDAKKVQNKVVRGAKLFKTGVFGKLNDRNIKC
jgi:hypothetical protein